jgi:hypothetical protein
MATVQGHHRILRLPQVVESLSRLHNQWGLQENNAMMRNGLMDKLLVTDEVHNSDLGDVELDFTTLSHAFINESCEEAQKLRLFQPPTVAGIPFVEYLCRRLGLLHDLTSGKEQEFYRWVIEMLSFHHIGLEFDRRRRRSFRLSQ